MKLKRYDFEKIDDVHLKIKRDYLTYLLSEIHKLNKIIDELEKWVNMQIDFLKNLDTIPNAKNIVNEHTTMVLIYQNILYKLQELKKMSK